MPPVEQQLAPLMRGTEFGDRTTRQTMESELRALLDQDRPLRVYCGYDPTDVDLHLGHTITFRKLRQFQDFGHEVTFLIGDFTGLVGDPSDRDKSRPLLSQEQLRENAETYAAQAFRILDAERTSVRHNAEWLSPLTLAEVIDLCSKFTVAQFLERDNFERRMERHDPIHLHEFLYAVMQAYDAVQLETDVQVGGTDQLFNLMAGRVLQREHGQQPQVVITTPLLVGTDGTQKMSKSAGNFIAVDDPPNDMYGKVMSLPDTATEQYFTLVTPLPEEEVVSILDTQPPMEAKKRLALEATAAMYSRAEAEAAQRYFESTIQRGETPEKMREVVLPAAADGRLNEVLVRYELAPSKSEVRRLVQQHAVQVNGRVVDDFTLELKHGDEVRVGPHRFLRVLTQEGVVGEST